MRIPRKSNAALRGIEDREDGPLPASPVDGLFTPTQRRLLRFLFGAPERGFHLRELVRLAGCGVGATHRELHRLEDAGLLTSTRRGARIHLQANAQSPIHAELTGLVRKTVGLAEPLREAFCTLQPLVLLAFAFEPARDPLAMYCRDLGMLVIAECSGGLAEALDLGRPHAEYSLDRSIFVITRERTALRDDPFVAAVLQRPRVWVFGDEARLAAVLG